ncbi:MAG TPA: valine--tRNA ligase [Candidatus Limnocylindrales bacterium]|nr:valine--tRNA ligase [Candidatus Limnocylindrales bacterium]
MASEMETRYDPASVEQRWYERWEERGYFRPGEGRTGKTFTISMPPPNITGDLHMGHAMYTLQDVLIRWHRMLGDTTLWVPGTDHAAIATQAVIERQLLKEKTSKEAIGREAFDVRVQTWYVATGDRILNQMRKLGFSADWSRLRFTMDPDYVQAIRHVFVQLWKEGLIYRGPRIVNWCPRDRSSISDLEVEYEERDDALYYLVYPVEGGGTITVATARPETMVGDTAVAVHPDDPRYQGLIGKFAILPLVGRRLEIVADQAVDPAFGTGAVKVTPGHDATDYEIGERHRLEVLSILHPDGRMDVPSIPELDHKRVTEAREAIVAMLKTAGALDRIEPYHHSVGHCSRCGAVIEPLVSAQWWVRMKPLAEPAIKVAEEGEVRFHPERFLEQYVRWMGNIRDWCISRQLWLGHRIPVWTCANGHQVAYLEDPAACERCGDRTLTQDPDVLDTWFSSALWPFATLGWPKDTPDLRRFYPTQVLDTAREILYLWVARMIFMSLHFLGTIPFEHVIIHGTVLDAQGRRMSKSLGNGVDPLVMIERYGADATRAWCAYFGTGGQDVRFHEEKIAYYRNFGNKLWNAARLLLGRGAAAPASPLEAASLGPADRWILGRLAAATRTVTEAFERMDFAPAIDVLERLAWHEFADDYLELMKAGLGSEAVAARVLEQTLRLLHPIMPFVTEELWQRLGAQGETIMYAPWPQPDPTYEDPVLDAEMAHLLDVVREVRHARHETDPRARRPPAEVESTHPLLREPVGQRYLATLAQIDLNGRLAPGARRTVVVGETRVTLSVPGQTDSERRRMEQDLARLQDEIARLRTRLDDPGFTGKAPKEIVERERARLRQTEEATQRLRSLLDASPE